MYKRQGYVYSVEPAAGTSVQAGSSVTLTVSRGVDYGDNAEVPSVVGMSKDDARTTLGKFSDIQITEQQSSEAAGTVIAQEPEAYAAADPDQPVYLTISSGDPVSYTHLDVYKRQAFGQIIPKSILDMPKFGCINIHASLLPKYRGAAPIQQAVIDGEKESGVTIMQMGTGLDTGDMISRIVVPLSEDETGGSLFDKLAVAGAELLVQTLPSIFDGTATREKQPEESPTPYAAMISKKKMCIRDR